MTKFFKAIVSYKGTHFNGWQIQAQGERTIQGEINKALKTIAKDGEVHTIGSGRTDAGVHALGQTVKITFPFEIEATALLKGLNSQLCQDIKVLEMQECEEEFRPTNDALWKEYVYRFTLSDFAHPLEHELMANFTYELNVEKMAMACQLFEGEHDFSAFQTVGTPVNSTVRKIFDCELLAEGHMFQFRVVGSGFLKSMVRLMVGTLIEIGRGKVSLEELEAALKNPGQNPDNHLGPVAPACGLYLVKAVYP